MNARKLKRSLLKRGLLRNKKGEAINVWPSAALPEGFHPTKGWGANSRIGKRNNRASRGRG